MAFVRQIVLGAWLLASIGTAAGASPDAPAPLILAAYARVYVTLVPRSAETGETPHLVDGAPALPALNLSLRSTRRNRLEFSLTRQDLLADGDRLQLRLASDAHIVAQLLSGGQFSELDDSWIAVLGLASRMRLSYNNGPFELSISARRRFGDGNVRARFTYGLRF